jgi:hypothetical protein
MPSFTCGDRSSGSARASSPTALFVDIPGQDVTPIQCGETDHYRFGGVTEARELEVLAHR